MPSGWDVYYVIFLSALLALGIPLSLGAISWLFSSARPERSSSKSDGYAVARRAASSNSTEANRIVLGKRINARFFLAANAALILITLILAFVPSATTLTHGSSPGTLVRGLVSVVSIAGFAALGLLYSARKGDLSWLASHQQASPPTPPEDLP